LSKDERRNWMPESLMRAPNPQVQRARTKSLIGPPNPQFQSATTKSLNQT